MGLQQSLILAPYTVFSPRLGRAEHPLYSGSTLVHQLMLSFLITLCLIAGGSIFVLGINPTLLGPILWSLGATITLILLREFVRRVSFAQFDITRVLVLDLFVAGFQISGLLFLAYLKMLSASRAYWVVGVGCGLMAVLWFISRRKMFRVDVARILPDLNRNWLFGRWLFAGSLVYMVHNQLYPWLLMSFHGAATTGVFAACIGVTSLTNPFLVGIGNLLGPKTATLYAQGESDELRRFVFRTTILLSLVMGLFCIVIALFGGQLVIFMYGPKYGGNGLLVSVLALGLFAWWLSAAFSYGLWAIERSDINFKINMIAFCVTATIGIWLAKVSGPLGVAYSLLAGNLAATLVRYIVFCRFFPGLRRHDG